MRFKVLFIFFLLLISCAKANPEQESVKKLIAIYNHALVLAYGELKFEELKSIASEGQFGKVSAIVNSFRDADEMMEAELLRLDFKEIKIEGNSSTVKTSEDWKYRWVNNKTGEEVEPLKDIHYDIIYHLTKKDGKWIVDRVEDVSIAGPSPRAQSNAGPLSRTQSG